jgi:hypothetical protein
MPTVHEGPPEVQVVVLIGHVADMLPDADKLRDAFRLQSNASVTTRGKLDYVLQLQGALLERLDRILEETQALRDLMEKRAAMDELGERMDQSYRDEA